MSDKYPGGFVTTGAPAGFSVAFNGSSDYLTLPASNTGLQFGTGDFTVEFWAYPTNLTAATGIGSSQIIFCSAGNSSFMCSIWNGNVHTVKADVADLYDFASTSVRNNTWFHVALCRASGSLKCFVNGVQAGSTTADTNNYSGTGVGSVGANYGGGYYFPGYVSNLRVFKGTALYTTTFTPPTQLFPITNTTLLTCQSPTLIDNSTTAATITAVSGAKVSNFTPFAGYTGFNPALGAAAGGVWTLDEAAYYQNNRQWPIYDPYFNQTTLMLHGNGTNGAQNNTFLDSSTNNFTITRNGNTTQGSFTPFSQTGWSNYFSGISTSFLSFPANSALALGNGAYTVEGWVYQTERASSDALFYSSSYASANADAFLGYIKNNGSVSIEKAFSGAVLTTAANAVPLNTWCHIAFVRTSTAANSTTIYVNGVAAATGTDANNWSNFNAPGIGMLSSLPAYAIFGYISNFRLVKGTAVYTSNFTPSTQPLTAVTGTSLLTCQDNYFVDNSAYNFTVTSAGTMAVKAFSPFVPAYITPTTYSNTFDGTGDYLTFPDTSTSCAFPAGTDFTIECWMFNKATTAQGTLWSTSSGINASEQLRIWFGDSTNTLTVWSTFTVKITSSAVFQNNVWYHVAVVRSGTTLTLYQNGVNVGSASNNQSFTSDNFTIANTGGSGGPYPMNGVVSNLRVVKGTALYTANFTPPTSPLTAISGTQILTCQSSTFKDNSTNNYTVTPTGDVKIIRGVPFSSSSVVVDNTTLNSAYSTSLIGGSTYNGGAGDGLSFLTSSTQFGVTGDFTIEVWIYPVATSSNYNTVFTANASTSSDNISYGLYYNTSYNLFWLNSGAGGNGFDAGSGINMVPYQWNHVAISRSGANIRCWTNGILRISNWAIGAIDGAQRYLYVGTNRSNADTVPGYMSGFRFVNGTAVYPTAANFAPPLLPPTNISNTAALVSSTNGAIFDNTAKNVLQTVGSVQLSTTQVKYGTTSMYFANGGTDYLVDSQVNNPNFNFGGDFTVEFWVYPTSVPGTYNGIIGNFSETGTTYGWNIMLTSSQLVHVHVQGTYGNSVQTVPLNAWTHLAITRSGSSVYTFVNGIRDANVLTTTVRAYNPVYPLRIGRQVDSAPRYFYGYLDDIRITNGTARYVASFTPPTSQLQDQ